jgi:hypothetical protein
MIAVKINSDKKWSILRELMRIDAVNVVKGPVYFLSEEQFRKLQEVGAHYELLTEEEAQTKWRESPQRLSNGTPA